MLTKFETQSHRVKGEYDPVNAFNDLLCVVDAQIRCLELICHER